MKYPLIILLLLSSFFGISQEKNYVISKTTEKIQLDGILDEAVWQNSAKATGFRQYFPIDSLMATSKTEFMLTYDDEFIYFAAIMYNQSPTREYVTPSLRRDFRGSANDGITLILDTFSDNTNAFQFGINPYGVRREGLVANGGQRGNDFDLSWDNKWYGESTIYEDYWVAEVAIPLKTLRYKEGSKTWNFNVYRVDSETGERVTWSPIPQVYSIISLAFLNELVWEEPLGKPGSNLSLIPYINGNTARDFEDAENTAPNRGAAFGADAKIGIGPSLNLDVTINPDFSQVEVDQQVTNLSRFEIRFPERRQFFLENADLFGSFGHPFLANPFFSRRIGIAIDTATGQNLQNKIHYGLRLSGKLDNNWRIGLLNMQAAADEEINLPAYNFSVAAVQRKVFARSNIGAFLVNRQAMRDTSSNEITLNSSNFNRVAGIDYNIASADNRWTGKVFYHRSFDNQKDPGEFAHAAWLIFRGRNLRWDWAHTIVGKNFDAVTGFAPRQGIFRFNPGLGWTFFPKMPAITQLTLRGEFESIITQTDENANVLNDQDVSFRAQANLANTGRAEFNLTRRYIFLLRSFDPTRTGGEPLPTDIGYTYTFGQIQFTSDTRKVFNFNVSGNFGQYFNGTRLGVGGSLNFRVQPILAVRMNIDYNYIRLPEPYATANTWLIGPRLDFTFTKSLFWTTFIQYNNQLDNMNINTRLQWRFAPVSDLFLVYTNNYMTQLPGGDWVFDERNRSLVLKLTYWFNL